MPKDHKRLGDLLLEEKLITAEDLSTAVAAQRKNGQLLGATLVQLGLVAEPVLLDCLQRQLGLPLVDLPSLDIDESTVALIKEDVAKKYLALPIAIEGRANLVVAMADPLNVAAIEDLRFHSGMFIKPVLASASALGEAIDRYYHLDRSVDEVLKGIVETSDDVQVSTVLEEERPEAVDALLKEAEGRPIVKLTNWLLARAVEDRASDIHLEPQHHELIVRLRIDGLLQEVQRLPKWTQSAIVSRLKVLSNLDIAEKRLPQDGRLMIEIAGRRVDMRVSTLPVTNGEKVVIRVVDQLKNSRDLTDLGLYADDLAKMKRFLERPQGIVLVTGPTGSGKSTLLYSALRFLQHETKNIVTVEDPVEFQLPGINQVQVDEKAKKTFPTALRAILRQDPDVIMIGEIRDQETAQIAFRASVTGHLVLSTIHTNDAATAVTRLVDLGLQPFMVASALVGVVSMRLVRTLCPRCRESYETSASNLDRLALHARGEGALTLWRGRGCAHCHSTGYHGRTGIFEVLDVDETMRALVVGGAHDTAIRNAAIEAGMRSIGEDGLKKVMEGQTTLDEVTRVTYLAEQNARVCPSCSTVLNQEFEYCPSCGGWVGEHCEGCRRRMNPAWDYCPFCGRGVSSGHEATATTPGRVARRRITRAVPESEEPARRAS
jgi:type IV pilus assembly protein PilB